MTLVDEDSSENALHAQQLCVAEKLTPPGEVYTDKDQRGGVLLSGPVLDAVDPRILCRLQEIVQQCTVRDDNDSDARIDQTSRSHE